MKIIAWHNTSNDFWSCSHQISCFVSNICMNSIFPQQFQQTVIVTFSDNFVKSQVQKAVFLTTKLQAKPTSVQLKVTAHNRLKTNLYHIHVTKHNGIQCDKGYGTHIFAWFRLSQCPKAMIQGKIKLFIKFISV
jgi:hypothetical protein